MYSRSETNSPVHEYTFGLYMAHRLPLTVPWEIYQSHTVF
jgi:hypothetical protein